MDDDGAAQHGEARVEAEIAHRQGDLRCAAGIARVGRRPRVDRQSIEVVPADPRVVWKVVATEARVDVEAGSDRGRDATEGAAHEDPGGRILGHYEADDSLRACVARVDRDGRD